MLLSDHQFIEKTDYFKEEIHSFKCLRYIQWITLFVGVISFFIFKESFLLAIGFYFILEVFNLWHCPLEEMMAVIQNRINRDAGMLREIGQ